ncbi:MAG: hypothetical protein EBY21_15495 [Alphaproteobacteria bacterium]|nr:hypothetical protein [Alphaproteobacteria bacterium]
MTYPLLPRYGREDFLVSSSNERAFELFERWPEWPDPICLVLGPSGAGKSHLAAIWAAQTKAICLTPADLAQADLATVPAGAALVLEDADRGGLDEKALFHLCNLTLEHKGFLVITAQQRPDLWGLTLPDLLSRLRRALSVEIAQPDDALVRAVLVKLFLDRQLRVDTGLIEFLALRIERSLDAARSIVDLLDREALSQQRAITRPMASEVLRRLDEGREVQG